MTGTTAHRMQSFFRLDEYQVNRREPAPRPCTLGQDNLDVEAERRQAKLWGAGCMNHHSASSSHLLLPSNLSHHIRTVSLSSGSPQTYTLTRRTKWLWIRSLTRSCEANARISGHLSRLAALRALKHIPAAAVSSPSLTTRSNRRLARRRASKHWAPLPMMASQDWSPKSMRPASRLTGGRI